jgi:hypothetical protein
MTILLITALVPACFFYVYALLRFQGELWNAKRDKFSGSEMILIRSDRGCPGAETDGLAVPSVLAAVETAADRSLAPPPGVSRHARGTAEIVYSEEVYRLESAYIGPLFLVSVSGGEVSDGKYVLVGKVPENAVHHAF